MAVEAWKDVKLVTTVSTYHNNNETTQAQRAGRDCVKPVVVHDYSKFMGGVNFERPITFDVYF